MSEYSFYEFQSIDAPLTSKQQSALRKISTRADITSRHFRNDYEYGDLKARPRTLLSKYFDAAFYMENWMWWQFTIKLPKDQELKKSLKPYVDRETFTLETKGNFLFLEIAFENEATYCEPVDHVLSSLAPIREEILSGDLRAAYLAWLAADSPKYADDPEPPVPYGLKELTPAQTAFVEFLDLNPVSVEAAARVSPPRNTVEKPDSAQWLKSLSAKKKDQLLLDVLEDSGGAGQLRREYLQWARDSKASVVESGRTVDELIDEINALMAQRRSEDEEKARIEKERAAEKDRRRREEQLAEVLANEHDVWEQVEDTIAERNAAAYRRAVMLLKDLKEALTTAGRDYEFADRMARIRRENDRKVNLMEQLRVAKL